MKNTLDFSNRGTAYCLPLDKINAIANKNSKLMIYMEGNEDPMAWDDDFEGTLTQACKLQLRNYHSDKQGNWLNAIHHAIIQAAQQGHISTYSPTIDNLPF